MYVRGTPRYRIMRACNIFFWGVVGCYRTDCSRWTTWLKDSLSLSLSVSLAFPSGSICSPSFKLAYIEGGRAGIRIFLMFLNIPWNGQRQYWRWKKLTKPPLTIDESKAVKLVDKGKTPWNPREEAWGRSEWTRRGFNGHHRPERWKHALQVWKKVQWALWYTRRSLN